MKECLLKRVLPFTLTFIVGAAVGGFFQLFGARDAGWRGRRFAHGYEGRRGCGKKFRRNYFAPQTKPLLILFKPDARWPLGRDAWDKGTYPTSVRVRVTFGADGHVKDAVPADWDYSSRGPYAANVWEAASRAARDIGFTPETIDGVPVSTTREVVIRFMAD
jgi:hypothetical protein